MQRATPPPPSLFTPGPPRFFQLVYELSLANERLEGEVARLRQRVLDLRRVARAAGCYQLLNDTALLEDLPELQLGTGGGDVKQQAQQQAQAQPQQMQQQGGDAARPGGSAAAGSQQAGAAAGVG